MMQPQNPMAPDYTNRLQMFLGSVVLAATGFLGEVQLSLAAHSVSGFVVGKVVLLLSAVLSGLLSSWGVVFAAYQFVLIAKTLPKGTQPDPSLPRVSRVGAWLSVTMMTQVATRTRKITTILNIGTVVFFVMLVLLLVYAVT